MKKLIAVILILAMILPAAALSDYAPKMGITINGFIDAFKSVEDNPVGVEFNDNMNSVKKWVIADEGSFAYLFPCKSSVFLRLYSDDPDFDHNMEAGVDWVVVDTLDPYNLNQLTAVTIRCLQILPDGVVTTFLYDGEYYRFIIRLEGNP